MFSTNLQLEIIASASAGPGVLNSKYPARHPKVALLDLPGPVIKDLLGVELSPEGVSVSFKLLTLNMVSPA